MIKYYRLKSSFDANGGKTHVEGRVHFELASSPEEARQKVVDDLKWWRYSNIKIIDCHEETEEEKYCKRPDVQTTETPVPVYEPKPATDVQEDKPHLEDVDELF